MNRVLHIGIPHIFSRSVRIDRLHEFGLGLLAESDRATMGFIEAGDVEELTEKDSKGYGALIVFSQRVTALTVDGSKDLVLVARWGVGYDKVDIDACTRNGIAVSITPDGIRRSMASTYVTFILALSHQLMKKDRLTRSGGWRGQIGTFGIGLVDRVLGLVGMGNIGREIIRLIAPFQMKKMVYDPYLSEKEADEAGVELVDLETLMRSADFLCICCMLNDETRGLISSDKLALMKKTSFLVNAARGPIVDQIALTEALKTHRIQGAALDVFQQEPVDPNDPILALDNVIVTPHAMGHTDQAKSAVSSSVVKSVLRVAQGMAPKYLANPAILESSLFQEKLARYRCE